MKALHIITGLNAGGAERALYNVLGHGLATVQDATVLALQPEGRFAPHIRGLGVPVYSLGLGRGVPGPLATAKLLRVARRVRPDIVQGWMYHGNMAASVAAFSTAGRRPLLVWNIRQSLYSLAAEKLLTRQVIRSSRWASRGADAIVYNSHLSRNQHEAYGFAASRGHVIPNGFDTEGLSPNDERGRTTRQALDIPLESMVVGHVARFHPMKDHATFLHAAVAVLRQRRDVVFLLAGREVNLENPELAGIVPRDLQGRFRFVGERDDIPDVMRAMDVFCQSSWTEAFPNVLGEAMALGIPCVATDVGDTGRIVGPTGDLVPPSDSSVLAKSLLAMLNRPPDARAALGSAARERIKARYALPAVVAQYRDLYAHLKTHNDTITREIV